MSDSTLCMRSLYPNVWDQCLDEYVRHAMGKMFVFLMTYAVKAAMLMRLVPHIKARLTPV